VRIPASSADVTTADRAELETIVESIAIRSSR
jgi:hypothetical protein